MCLVITLYDIIALLTYVCVRASTCAENRFADEGLVIVGPAPGERVRTRTITRR